MVKKYLLQNYRGDAAASSIPKFFGGKIG